MDGARGTSGRGEETFATRRRLSATPRTFQGTHSTTTQASTIDCDCHPEDQGTSSDERRPNFFFAIPAPSNLLVPLDESRRARSTSGTLLYSKTSRTNILSSNVKTN